MIFHFHAPLRELHPQRVAGRLQFFAQNWQIITQDPWVLQTIRGYKIDLLSHPRQTSLPSPPLLSPPQTSLVQEEIISLLQKGAIIEVAFNPWVGILQQPLSCGEEGRVRATPSNQPFQVQQLCGILPLQDGRLESSCRPIETRGFHVQTRPERRLFLGPPSQAVSEIHPLSVPRQDVPIHLSPIRADIRPTYLHQNTQTSNRDSKKDGHPDNSLSGRYAHYEHHLRGCQERHHDFEINSREFRIPNQHGEIHICSCTDHRIPGNHRGLHDNEVSPPRRESCCYSERVSPLGKQSSHLFKSTLSHNREVNFLQNCSSSSPSSLSGDPTFEEQQHASPGSQQRRHTFGSSCPRGPQVVGRQSLPGKWTPHSEFPSASNDSIRCLQFGVGSSEQWGRHQGNLDKGGIQSSYQLQRATSSIICSESIHQRAAKCPCVDSNRQYTTIAYINKIGGAKRCLLDHYARHLWAWCLQRRITLRAEHIPGCLYTIADRESRA